MSLLSGPGRFEEAVSTALGLSILFIYLRLRRGSTLKPLEVFEVVYFGSLAVIGLLASGDLIRWLEKWSGEMSSLALAAFTFGSLLVGDPFTLPYAKETTPREYWDFPVFLRINRVITLVWALAFTLAAAAGLYGDAVLDQPDNFWTAWIIPIAAMLFAFSFSEWYPDVAAQKPLGRLVSLRRSLLRLASSSTSFLRSSRQQGSLCSSPTPILPGWPSR